jgi:hypothetical protein
MLRNEYSHTLLTGLKIDMAHVGRYLAISYKAWFHRSSYLLILLLCTCSGESHGLNDKF